MVAYAPYVAGTATLSSVFPASSLIPAGHNVTSTIKAVDYCHVSTATVYEYATAYPVANAHGHGGPYYNPYNDVPLPYTWPGKPSHGETTAPPKPTPPYPYGGPAKDHYDAPAWIPKGYDKLVPSLPKGKQNGNSKWGEIDCPHLPVGGLPGGPSYSHSTPSHPTSVPYPTSSVSGSASYSMNSTKITASTSYSSTSTPAPNCPTMPDTGVTRTYDLHVAYQTIAPDGVTRNGLTINGQFPGPLVEANW